MLGSVGDKTGEMLLTDDRALRLEDGLRWTGTDVDLLLQNAGDPPHQSETLLRARLFVPAELEVVAGMF